MSRHRIFGVFALFACVLLAWLSPAQQSRELWVTRHDGPVSGNDAAATIAAGSSGNFPRRTSAEIPDATKHSVLESYGKLPFSFEVNQGQTDDQVKFLSRGSGYTLFLTSEEAVLALRVPTGNGDRLAAGKPGLARASGKPDAQPSVVVRMKLVGANRSAQVRGVDELPGKSNYFLGNDPKKWRTNVPTYARVEYTQVYPGVDLVYYGNPGQLEYDFVLAPGADPRAIHLAVEGIGKMAIDADGNLVLHARHGEILLGKPLTYQEENGVRKEVGGRYVVQGKNRLSFEVRAYDATRPLIIDPVLGYSTYLGGSRGDGAGAIAVDAAGNAYVTGFTRSTNFPTMNPFQATFVGMENAFVTKFNAAGNALVYSTYLGGSGSNGCCDVGAAIAVDAAGNAYVTGQTASTDFPTMNAFQPTSGGNSDAFVTKFNAAGSALVYSTYLGGSNFDAGRGIALDAAGNAYVTGDTFSTNFPTMNPFQATQGSDFGNAFVTKFNAAGSALVYSTYLGGGNVDKGWGIAVDPAGSAYVTGLTGSTNFPTVNPFQATLGSGGGNAFVTKFSTAGNTLVYSTYLGGGTFDRGSGIAVDAAGEAYVIGSTSSTNFPTANPFKATLGANINAFVTKFNAAGNALVYSTYLGGSVSDIGNAIAVDAFGNAYVTGQTASNNFPTADPLQATLGSGGASAFVTKFNAVGSALMFSSYLGGNGTDFGSGIAADAAGNAYVTGSTTSTNFPTANPFQSACGGCPSNSNAFVSKITFSPAVVSLSTSGLVFSSQLVGTSSSAQMVTVQNMGDGQLTVTAISTGGANGGDFADSGDNCVSSSLIAPGGSCTINVKFTPTAAGNRTATLSIADNAANTPQTVSLTGTGADFSLSAASGGSTSATVTAGQTATYNLQVNPLSGFTGSVSVSCTGAPTNASCTPSASSVNVTGASSVPFSVSVPTMAHGTLPRGPLDRPGPPRWYLPVVLFALFLLLACSVDWAARLGKRRYAWAFAGIFIALFASYVAGCGSGSGGGGGGGGGTQAGTYNLTVTGTSQGQNRTVALTLMVN